MPPTKVLKRGDIIYNTRREGLLFSAEVGYGRSGMSRFTLQFDVFARDARAISTMNELDMS